MFSYIPDIFCNLFLVYRSDNDTFIKEIQHTPTEKLLLNIYVRIYVTLLNDIVS